jgi:hypothetical protein
MNMVEVAKAASAEITKLLTEFSKEFQPLENEQQLIPLVDSRTGANYCECHIKASKLIELGTIDVPLDYEEQAEYRANREIVLNNPAYNTMIEDAKLGRTFSNIVTEYTKEFDKEHPLKVIGGQHRFAAIEEALKDNVDQYHGVKVYLGLEMTQRLDVQLISNTNIAISADLFDRLQETFQGPELREWCQSVGLIEIGQDFADSYKRGGPISVKVARTFITNYFKGKVIDTKHFEQTDSTPILCPSGGQDADWQKLKSDHPNLWKDQELAGAGKEFAALISAQREAFNPGKKPKAKTDYPEKALNIAVISAWGFVAGMLQGNPTRLKRHYALRSAVGKDPLNAKALADGRHKSDAENYRGLGYRTDAKERGRFVELFSIQAEEGKGITPSNIDIAIQQYHVKQSTLELMRSKAKAKAKEKE